ncbi:SCO2400 family protein [Streptomyces sp. NBC_00328]|uniref:SCO2400 family protein n=1 Tax=Streptomyces sp. NBC_00328 TaxID=2903646 RepID=UPI002E293634|nr:hypothetical protein [Streptomyces sp. NBC_00328]
MDYCHVCRRHLNGALACPGCGTPVDELGADTDEAGARPPTGADADARHGADGDVEWRSRRAARRRGGRVLDAEAGSPGDPQAPAGASRRDRKAAAHRRRRRRTLYMAVGFVLAAGGLSLAELGVDAPGLGPSPAAAESPDGSASPAASSLPKKAPSESPSAGRTPSSSASASRSPSASASASPAAASGKSAEGSGSPTLGTRPGHSASAPATASAGSGASAPAGTDPTASAPAPTPSSSDDCNRFLWWCS